MVLMAMFPSRKTDIVEVTAGAQHVPEGACKGASGAQREPKASNRTAPTLQQVQESR